MSIYTDYKEQKAQRKDSVLLFKLGSFYEAFFEDANDIGELLDIFVSKVFDNTHGTIPICGFMGGFKEQYFRKIREKGRSIVIMKYKQGNNKVSVVDE